MTDDKRVPSTEVVLAVEANVGPTGAIVVNLRCPVCGREGAFHGTTNVQDLTWVQALNEEEPQRGGVSQFAAGSRICPNLACQTPVFVILRDKELYKSFPPQMIDFDATSIPRGVKNTLEEAIKCNSIGAYKASAMMVRRVLEEVCQDRGAKGKDLQQRLLKLEEKIVVPAELLEAANDSRRPPESQGPSSR